MSCSNIPVSSFSPETDHGLPEKKPVYTRVKNENKVQKTIQLCPFITKAIKQFEQTVTFKYSLFSSYTSQLIFISKNVSTKVLVGDYFFFNCCTALLFMLVVK